jgi:diaminopimelate decarboxylase
MPGTHSPTPGPWWARPGLEPLSGRLAFAGCDAEELARRHGTPLYVYDPTRVEANVSRLVASLDRAGLRSRPLYAIKANRHAALLARVRSMGRVGIDACSPHEVALALASGWTAPEISYTGTNLSERDLDGILPHDLVLNLDSLSALRRVGARAPGRRIGLRVNPQVGTGYSAQLTYAGDKPTKFGVYAERFDDALKEARRHRLEVTGLHFHVGSGWLREGLDLFLGAARRAAALARKVPSLEYVNVGGGIGVPLQASDRPVDLDAYASGIARELAGLDVAVYVEPGDFLVKDAGILLVEVVTVEEKGGVRFVGVDCGFNAFPPPALYHYPQEIVLARAADAEATMECTVAGHINEAGDLFAEKCRLPEVREGDVLAFLYAGGYAAAMSSYHCARPAAAEIVL